MRSPPGNTSPCFFWLKSTDSKTEDRTGPGNARAGLRPSVDGMRGPQEARGVAGATAPESMQAGLEALLLALARNFR